MNKVTLTRTKLLWHRYGLKLKDMSINMLTRFKECKRFFGTLLRHHFLQSPFFPVDIKSFNAAAQGCWLLDLAEDLVFAERASVFFLR